ncbi:hypothetical protein GDO86_005131 [Hymenochirus boettgeri]|uniref:Mitochondrial transcription termination factor 2 n=1 Tax=Hymenochirus boettgeri TaxID=247094 RepID=A0A8T2J0L9_9PIPI|nr:hypothetical protein GDO86_005131 [Hymenochirus boettgeri]
MLKGMVQRLVSFHTSPGTCYVPNKQIFLPSKMWSSKIENYHTENKKTVENLYGLCVNIKKIRQLKGWALRKEVGYVEETSLILKEMGASEITIANIFESCPEAFLQNPSEVNIQRRLWLSVCPSDEQLVKIIEKFPDSFFCYKSTAHQRANISYFQQLGISNKIICRLLTGSPQIFCNSVAGNKLIIDAVEENYLCLGGKNTNFKTWLMKLLSQDPFILLKSPVSMKENLMFLQRLGFSDENVLKLLSRLKGFVFDLSLEEMENCILFLKSTFECTEGELREIIIKCPGLLCFSVEVLEDRIKCLLAEGVTVGQITDCPGVLELTTQIVQFRIQKIRLLGHNLKGKDLQIINGTKKDFEVNYGKLCVHKERPLFNPVSPLPVEE